jgi:hypothetical protein
MSKTWDDLISKCTLSSSNADASLIYEPPKTEHWEISTFNDQKYSITGLYSVHQQDGRKYNMLTLLDEEYTSEYTMAFGSVGLDTLKITPRKLR